MNFVRKDILRPPILNTCFFIPMHASNYLSMHGFFTVCPEKDAVTVEQPASPHVQCLLRPDFLRGL